MSLILDALNRARQDNEPVPGLATRHPTTKLSAWRRYLILLLVLAVVVLALVGWWFLRGSTAAEDDVSGGSAVGELSRNVGSVATAVTTQLKARVAAQRETAAEGESAFQGDAAPEVTAIAAPASEVVSVPPLSAAPTATPAIPIPVNTGEMPAASTASNIVAAQQQENTAVADLYKQRAQRRQADPPTAAVKPRTSSQRKTAPAEVAQTKQQEQSVDLEELLQRAREELQNEGLAEHAAPFVTALSQSVKDSIPTVLYQQHDFSKNGGRSSVVLNGKALRVGGSPVAGMKVEEILPQSVVLRYQGTQFRLRALNSWVNL